MLKEQHLGRVRYLMQAIQAAGDCGYERTGAACYITGIDADDRGTISYKERDDMKMELTHAIIARDVQKKYKDLN